MIWEILAWATFPVAIVFFGWATQDDDENWFWGPVVSGGLIYLGIKTTHLPVWSWAKDNLYGLMFIAVYYLVAGVAWSMIKFYAKAKKITKEDINSRAMMYSDGVIRSDDTEKAERDMFYDIFKKTPKWIAFWPASLAWSALSNWLKEFFVMVADAFKKTYWRLFKAAIGE